MFYIKVYSKLYNTNEFYEVDVNSEEVVFKEKLEISEIPEIFYDGTHKRFDAYNIEFGMIEIICKSTENERFYQVETKKSMFRLVEYLEKHSGQCELFDYWRAHQRSLNFFLELRVLSVSEKLLEKYFALIEKWIRVNGVLLNQNGFAIPESIIGDADNPSYSSIRTEIVIKASKLAEKRTDINQTSVSWDTDWPEFNGAGSDFVYFAAGVFVPLIMSYLGISSTEQREYRKEKKAIDKYRKEILKDKTMLGDLRCPENGDYISNHKYYKIYIYEEVINGICVAQYRVQFRKRSKISKEKVSIEKVTIENSDRMV